MGASQSSAEVFVNMCIDAAVSSVHNAVSEACPAATQEQSIEIDNCKIVRIPGGIDQYQTQRMNMSSISKLLADDTLEEDVSASIKAAVESEADAAIGWASSHTDTVVDITKKITTSVMTDCRALSNSIASQVQRVAITGCDETDIAFIHQTQMDDIVAKAFSKSSTTSKLKQTLIDEVDAEGLSKAKGWDVTFMVIAIAVVICIFVFGGFDMVAANVMKPSGLFMLSIPFLAWGVWDLIKSVTQNNPDQWDTDKDAKRKKDRKRRDTTRGTWISCIFGIAALISGYIFVSGNQSKKKQPQTVIVQGGAPVPVIAQ